MTAIRHIVLDLGNVLVRWDPERPYLRLIPEEAERRRFLAEICNPAWLAAIDRGSTWQEAEKELIARFPREEPLIRAFRQHWHEMVPHALEETVEVLEKLIAAGYDVTALSNMPADTYDELFPRFPFLYSFRGITASGRVGLIKPDKEIYSHHVSEFGLQPQATLFFDDMPANVAAARAAGWHAEQFIDGPTMRADLARHGITV
jgi:HAD superfamily hydrolase (TIGR01509 family)